MASLLGRLLRYVNDAVQYADGHEHKGRRASGGMFDEYLTTMAERDAYGRGETVDVDAAMRLAVVSAWAYSDVALIADRAAARNARPMAKRRTGEEADDLNDHPFERLLSRPNDVMTSGFLLRYIAWWYLLRGNAYVFISTIAAGRGEPEELWPLPANLVRPLPGTG